MSELRKDPLVGRWVIVATERAKRPSDYIAEETPEAPDPARNPFAEGNERQTPPEVFAIRDPGSQPNGPGWQLRVVPNRFPALRIEGDLGKEGQGMYDKMNGIGAHEVIIETPDPDQQIEDQPPDGIARVIEAYQARMTDLMQDPRVRYVMIFRNFGRRAGASLVHPHSQLIATPITPKRVKEKLLGAMQYYAYKDRSIFGDILRQELLEGTRLVYENEGFVAFCPFASRFPFEITIMPRRQTAYFQNIQPAEVRQLADILRACLRKLDQALHRPQYNYILTSAPSRYAHPGYWATIDQDFRWHIDILPRLTQIAGFEVGTGFYINPMLPEEAAKCLREVPV